MENWNLQSEKDILIGIIWESVHYELKMKDGSIIKAIGFTDETKDGGIKVHLEDVETYDPIDTDDISMWREWVPMSCR